MKVTVWILFHIFLGTQSNDPKSINLDLQATLVFEPEDAQSPYIQKVRTLLDKLVKSSPKQVNLTEHGVLSTFLTQLAVTIIHHDNKQRNEVLKTLSKIADDFPKILNKTVRANLKKTLKKCSKLKPESVDSYIVKFSKDSKFRLDVRKQNKFYNDTDKVKLDKIIKKFGTDKPYNISKIYTKIFKICLFDKYNSLDKNERKEFEKNISKILKHMNLDKYGPDKNKVSNIVRGKTDGKSKLNTEANEITFYNDVIIKVSEAMRNNSEELDRKKVV